MKKVLSVALLLSGLVAQAQQCQPGQWCTPQPYQQPAPVYQQPQQPQPDPWEETRRRNEAMAEAERQRQAQNRPMCTTYHKDPITGQVTAVTQPCNAF